MPKDLIDASQWEDVEVPVGTDPATAGSVETPFQILANRTRYLLERIVTSLVLNFFEVDASAIGPSDTGGVLDGVHDPITGADVVVDFTSGNVFEDQVALGGMIYEHGPGGSVTGDTARLAVDHEGNIVCVTQQSGGHGVIFSPTPLGTWVDWTAGIPAGSWVRAAHDWLGRWVIGGSTGTIRQSTGPGVAFAAPTVDPGFPNAIYALRHSHHPADLLSPDDPGNQFFMALSPTRWSRSADGMTWTASAVHDLGGHPLDLAYSAQGQRWIAPVAGLGDPDYIFAGLGVSDDNGTTWTLDDEAIDSELASLGSLNGARIACDGRGGWVLALAGTVGTGESATPAIEIWASWDNGETWTRVHLPAAPQLAEIALWYGGGRFHLMTTDLSGTWAGFASLRLEE